MIKARLVGKEFADDAKKGELFAGTPGPLALRYLVSMLATYTCSEERKCVGVMDVQKVPSYMVVLDDTFSLRGHRTRRKQVVMVYWRMWWDRCTEHLMLQ